MYSPVHVTVNEFPVVKTPFAPVNSAPCKAVRIAPAVYDCRVKRFKPAGNQALIHVPSLFKVLALCFWHCAQIALYERVVITGYSPIHHQVPYSRPVRSEEHTSELQSRE